MAEEKIRIVRYLRTSAMTRVLKLLDDSAIVGMNAKRNIQVDAQNNSPVPYVNRVTRTINSFDVYYNSHHHGQFESKKVLSALEDPIEDALVEDVDLLLPESFSKRVGAEIKGAEKYRFVLHMVHYPCRRDGEKNSFWADVYAHMTEEEKSWMEPGSLDFEYFVPAPVFRDLSKRKGRVGADYRAQLAEWTKHAGKKPPLVRAAMESVIDEADLLSSRSYRWGPEEKWILDKIGSF